MYNYRYGEVKEGDDKAFHWVGTGSARMVQYEENRIRKKNHLPSILLLIIIG